MHTSKLSTRFLTTACIVLPSCCHPKPVSNLQCSKLNPSQSATKTHLLQIHATAEECLQDGTSEREKLSRYNSVCQIPTALASQCYFFSSRKAFAYQRFMGLPSSSKEKSPEKYLPENVTSSQQKLAS